MARIQILELPMRHLGPASESPFVFVIDQADPGLWAEGVVEVVEFGKAAGAVTVLVTEHTLDVG